MPTDLFLDVLGECAYEGIIFPCADAKTDGGHDSVEHTAYLRRGADVEPTGQQAYRGTLTAPMLVEMGPYGDLFPAVYRSLVQKFETTPIGVLAHPTLGSFRAHIKSWSERLSPTNRSGVVLEISWVEHNGQASVTLGDPTAVPRDTPAAALNQSTATDAAMAAADPNATYAPTAALFATQLAFLEGQTRTPGEVASALGLMLAVVNGNLALPVFAVTSTAEHAAVMALEGLRATTYQLRARYLGTRALSPRTYVNPRTQPIWAIAQTLYGDTSKASLLLAANALPDPLYVRAGLTLVVPPPS